MPEDSPLAGKTVAELEALGEGEVEVLTLIRERDPPLRAAADAPDLRAGDVLILQGEPAALERLVGEAKLKLARDESTGEIDAPRRRDRRDGSGGDRRIRRWSTARPRSIGSASATRSTCSRSAAAASASRSGCARCGSSPAT